MRNHHERIRELVEARTASLIEHVRRGDRLAIVQAPPGSGKTYLLLRAVKEALRTGQRVAIATQTRSQADDVCRRLLQDFGLPAVRFVAHNGVKARVPQGVQVVSNQNEVPSGPTVVVATTAKWGLIELARPFDLVIVEEAWQMAWADFMLLGQVAPRFILIGDPGQIPPVVSIDTARWETAPRGPHRAAPELVLSEGRAEALSLTLPATRRLPSGTAELIRPFYDFPFDSWALPEDRSLIPGRRVSGVLGTAAARLQFDSVVALTLPTPAGGPPLQEDEEIAEVAVHAARTILECQPEALIDGKRGALTPSDIGLCATHHVMNSAMALRLDGRMGGVAIDTPERWQGLERKVMIVVHPLSGVMQPSEFDLTTGRLCVMASRHQVSLIVVSRDHVTHTLETHLPAAEQPVGRPDACGAGHSRNLSFWTALHTRGSIIAA